MSVPKILIAGIGNIFNGDDGFGVAVAQALMRRTLPPEARVVDFGIRGIDLAYALLEPYELVILVDAAQCGAIPGTVHLIEPKLEERRSGNSNPEPHGMVPTRAIDWARAMGANVNLVLVSCEPGTLEMECDGSGLSSAVENAVSKAVRLIESVIEAFLGGGIAAGMQFSHR
jgi:hydrogenase maturation protease